MWLPTINCVDGECYVFNRPFVSEMLTVGYYRIASGFELMNYIDDKYWRVTLETICDFKKEVRREYAAQIEAILGGFGDGEVW